MWSKKSSRFCILFLLPPMASGMTSVYYDDFTSQAELSEAARTAESFPCSLSGASSADSWSSCETAKPEQMA
jgi:hypothetical protein